MRVTMVTSIPLPPREGIGNHVYNVSRHLMERGHEVTILTRGSWRGSSRCDIGGVSVRRIRFLPFYPVHVHIHGLFLNSVMRRMPPPDIVHLHTPLVPAVNGSAPAVTSVHTPMAVDSRQAELANALGVAIKLQAPVSRRLEKALFRRSALVTSVSRSVAAELEEYGLDPACVAVTGNGTDHEVFRPRNGGGPSAGYVLAVGRLAYRKGLFDLIRAAALVAERYPKVKFLLAGDGPLERSLRSLTRRLGLSDTVTFLGHIDHDDPALIRLYQDCALYVQASRYEGLPGTLLEAMACGAPVVATAVSAHLDVIESGENGLLAPAGSPQGLADAICTVLANSSLAERLGAAARLVIEQGYTWDHVTDRVLDGYNRVLTACNGGE